jgi:hypothetical protein
MATRLMAARVVAPRVLALRVVATRLVALRAVPKTLMFIAAIAALTTTNSAAIAAPAKREPAGEKGWVLKQVSISIGQQIVYVTPHAVKAVNAGQGVTTIARAPDWKVIVYNDEKQCYFESQLSQWKGPPIQSVMLFLGLDASRFVLRKIGQGTVAGQQAICYKPEIQTVMKPGTNKKIWQDDQINASRCVGYWTADAIKVPGPAANIISRTYAVTENGHLPLRLIYRHDRRDRIGLDTTSVKATTIEASAFDLPGGYKRVLTNAAVLMDE